MDDKQEKELQEYLDRKIKIDLVKGVEGKSIYIDDHRVVGSKPWGGGGVEMSRELSVRECLRAFPPILRALGLDQFGEQKNTRDNSLQEVNEKLHRLLAIYAKVITDNIDGKVTLKIPNDLYEFIDKEVSKVKAP